MNSSGAEGPRVIVVTGANPGTRPARRTAGPVLELVAWWIAGTAFWLATASTVTVAETIAASLAALIGAVLVLLARRAMPFSLRPRRAWLRWASVVPLAALADAVRLARWLPGPQEEELREGSMPASRGPVDTGWRAGAMIALSATPGTVVLDCDPGAGKLLVHSLVEGWPGLGRMVLPASGARK